MQINDLQINEDQNVIDMADEEIVKWRKNLFSLSLGRIGKIFIGECTKLVNSWCEEAPNYKNSIKRLMILPDLILQKTNAKAKAQEIKAHVERRLQLWEEGKIRELLDESRAIQKRLKEFPENKRTEEDLIKIFKHAMLSGNVRAA